MWDAAVVFFFSSTFSLAEQSKVFCSLFPSRHSKNNGQLILRKYFYCDSVWLGGQLQGNQVNKLGSPEGS